MKLAMVVSITRLPEREFLLGLIFRIYLVEEFLGIVSLRVPYTQIILR